VTRQNKKTPAGSWRYGISQALIYADVKLLLRGSSAVPPALDDASCLKIGLARRGELAILAAKEEQRLTGKQFGGLYFS
jgi:hypothetical protein